MKRGMDDVVFFVVLGLLGLPVFVIALLLLWGTLFALLLEVIR